MVDRGSRVKKRKFRRTPGARVSVQYSRSKRTKARCAVTGKVLLGTGNQVKSAVRKVPKSVRRPSVKFGGVLSGEARRIVFEEFALVESGSKRIEDVPSKYKGFVESLLRSK